MKENKKHGVPKYFSLEQKSRQKWEDCTMFDWCFQL